LLKLEYLPCNRHDKGAASPRFMLFLSHQKGCCFCPPNLTTDTTELHGSKKFNRTFFNL
jgi:hypothetical protein